MTDLGKITGGADGDGPIGDDPKAYFIELRRRFHEALIKSMENTGKGIQRRADRSIRAGAGPGKSDPNRLSRRSGALAKSIAWVVDRRANLYVGAGLGPSGVYAKLHETGEPREITPNPPRKWLTLPRYPAALTPAGREKERPKSWRRTRTGPLFFHISKRNPDTAFLRHSRTGDLYYLLKKKVRTRKRPYLKPAIDGEEPVAVRRIRNLYRQAARHGGQV